LVAAYFAALGAVKKTATTDGEALAGRLGIWSLKKPKPHEFEPPVYGHLRFYEAPNSTNPNLHAQAGLFTILVGDIIQPVDEYLKGSGVTVPDLVDEDCPLMRLFSLSREQAPRLLQLLADEGYDGATMFPGHDGVVMSLREQALYPKG
jgi:hypothetical protein